VVLGSLFDREGLLGISWHTAPPLLGISSPTEGLLGIFWTREGLLGMSWPKEGLLGMSWTREGLGITLLRYFVKEGLLGTP